MSVIRLLNIALLAFCVGGWTATGAAAKPYALLVGVSAYDSSIGLSNLRGPANDVRLLRDVLAARAAFDIIVLADGVEGSAGRPTREAVLSALSNLAGQAESGDFVYIHLSGHGTRQRDMDGDESDGLDEVFLPADTGRAEPGSGVIPGAILDEELGAAVDAIRAKGADVWFVLDSCHSGSGLRAASPDIAARFVDPAVLGVSVDAAPAPAGPPLAVQRNGDLPGRYLAFYAAQSSEVAREIQVDAEAQNGWYGLFTSRLAARLMQEGAISYRQLFQAVLADMNDSTVPGAARLQTPIWEGNLIDAAVLGGRDTVGLRQFALRGDEISAGLVHGLMEGTVLALVADAADGVDAVLGHAQAEDVEATRAWLAPVGADCLPEAGAPCPRLEALPAGARFARVVAKPVDLVVRLSPPIEFATGTPVAPDHPLARALAQAVAEVNAGTAGRIELDPAGFAITVAVAGDALWFGRTVTAGDSPVGLSWAPDDGPLAPLLVRILRAEQVAAMLSSVSETGSPLFPSPVNLAARLTATRVDDLSPPGAPDDLFRECRRALGSVRGTAPQPLAPAANVKQCDQIVVSAKGAVQGQARDVNRVHIDSQFCIDAAYERVEGTATEALIGAPVTICSDCPGPEGTVQSAGHERMFLIVTEAQDNSEALNLEGLMENCVAPDPATRAANSRRTGDFLAALGSRRGTRGSMGSIGVANIWVEQYQWLVLPRRQAFVRAGLDPGP